MKFVVSMLPPEALNFGDGDPLDPDIRHRLANFVHLEGFDDRGDQLHAFPPAFTR
jgi:hypothetical protein